jgi:hypothetical protein
MSRPRSAVGPECPPPAGQAIRDAPDDTSQSGLIGQLCKRLNREKVPWL